MGASARRLTGRSGWWCSRRTASSRPICSASSRNLSGWPFIAGIAVEGTGLPCLVAGAPLLDNLHVPRLHAPDVHRQLGHRTGDHQRGRDHAARPRDPDDPAPRGPAARRLTGVVEPVVEPVGEPGLLGSTSRIRSSPGRGSPRPSRLLVLTHSRPSGAAATVRIRPYLPTRGRPGCTARSPSTSTRHSRSPAAPPSTGGRRARPGRR